jgi:phenylpyruvate tautomerase PptA (4-oxalocrotonate tautomerase family)
MPILDVEIILQPDETLPIYLAAELAEAAGHVFNSAPGETWVKLKSIPAGQYAENGSPSGVTPVFVSVLKARHADLETTRIEVARLTMLVARLCLRPAENVHIIYLPEGLGRVAFGGQILTE